MRKSKYMFTNKLMSFAAAALLIGTVAVQGASAGSGANCPKTSSKCHSKKQCPSAGNHMKTCCIMKSAGMCSNMKNKKAVTIFAPTDAAWEKMPKAKREALMKNHKQLHKVLAYHIVPRKLTKDDLANMRSAKTEEGEFVMINNKDGSISIDGAIIKGEGQNFKNATIYEIDEVLVPERGK